MERNESMDARILQAVVWMARKQWQLAALALVLTVSMGARYQTPNFTVETPDPNLAQRFGQAAEKYRRDLAIDWLGKAMPNWARPCTLTVHVGPQLGAGGATTFIFDRGEVFGWRMTIQGSAERILDSVLPHEITHMIFASYFRRPLPRWADEGGATSTEHPAERAKHRTMLVQFLRTGRGIAFNQMFAMTEYPRDVMPLYAQGYTLAEFLIQRGGRRKYVEFLADGLESSDWPAMVRAHYGIRDLGTLQNTWLTWVRQGFPDPKPQHPGSRPGELLVSASASSPHAAVKRRERPEPNLIHRIRTPQNAQTMGPLVPVADAGVAHGAPPQNPAPRQVAAASSPSAVQVLPRSGWRAPGTPAQSSAPEVAAAPPAADPFQAHVTRPQPFEQPRQTILEWSQR